MVKPSFLNLVTWFTMLLRSPTVRSALLSLAADTSSVAASYSTATPVVADARGDSPREVDLSLVVDYECESDEWPTRGD